MLAGLDWLDSLSLTGLDGQNLNEIGLKNGNLVVDDQQRGNKWTFENISLSLRRPSGGGVALSLGEEGARPWSLRVVVGPQQNGVRSVDIRADKVPAANILLAMRVKDLTYSADLPLIGRTEGRTRPRRSADLFPRQDHAPAPATSSTAIRLIIRWRSIRRK